MRRHAFVLALALLPALAQPCLPRTARADEPSPHMMVLPNGKLDESKCGACHTKDMSLISSPLGERRLCRNFFQTSFRNRPAWRRMRWLRVCSSFLARRRLFPFRPW